jgi:ADP-ribose pyrophosphatase YjhB (NUDIX family)
MGTSRKFAHFKRDVVPPRTKEVPEGGFCISAFVIISKKNKPEQVLMGRINKKAAWEHVGALDPERMERHSVGWMLPSSGLLLGESPRQAANRILNEQLNAPEQILEGPSVFSEVYGPMNHWDLEFLFLGERDSTPENDLWRELKFIDITKTRRAEIVRGHEDILAHVGKRTAD